jgi:hypothetical protein
LRLAAITLVLFAAAHAARLTLAEFRGIPHDSPRSSDSWIAEGLAAEEARDYAHAERALLEAARIDRQYLPAWTLANFYFRRNDPEHFWPWARHAARMAYDDRAPLVRLAHEFEPDPRRILDRLGDTPELRRGIRDIIPSAANPSAANL